MHKIRNYSLKSPGIRGKLGEKIKKNEGENMSGTVGLGSIFDRYFLG